MESARSNGDDRRRRKRREENAESMAMKGGEQEGQGDAEAWNQFATTFDRVQTVLDRNRDLIQRVNENHQSRGAEDMARNVMLIQELNGNISKVVDLYSDLSGNFSSGFQQRRKQGGGKSSGN